MDERSPAPRVTCRWWPALASVIGLLLLAAGIVAHPNDAASVQVAPFGPAPSTIPEATAHPPSPTNLPAPSSTDGEPLRSPSIPPPTVAVGHGPPVSVWLPGVDHAVPVAPVGVSADGELAIPDDPQTVGWWVGGAMPGSSQGIVVLAGHLDSHRYGTGAFASLRNVNAGDPVVLLDGSAATFTYRVTARLQVPKTALPPELFDPAQPPGLVMVTCGGAFDSRSRHYADNIIIVAEPLPPTD
jgi:hypothetical protein